jgi:hypothetical protein
VAERREEPGLPPADDASAARRRRRPGAGDPLGGRPGGRTARRCAGRGRPRRRGGHDGRVAGPAVAAPAGTADPSWPRAVRASRARAPWPRRGPRRHGRPLPGCAP